ncbi:DUF4236 domain-containing protein [Thauera butanivorans]|uniref:DUF4236 domain-containing protein n=1 Tax=Thauera butanivorans TaxID=86174 RepID=UPI000A020355
MGWRFQRRVKILPGVTLNFSKSGVSTSFGPRGLRYTIGHGKRRLTLGIPGTGVHYTEVTSKKRRARPPAPTPIPLQPEQSHGTGFLGRALIVVAIIIGFGVLVAGLSRYTTITLLLGAIIATIIFIIVVARGGTYR